MQQEPLPQVTDAVTSAPAAAAASGESLRLPLRILAADDVRTNREWIRQLAGHFGYEATIVVNGAEVLAALGRNSFDLILLDVQMPVMDGLTAAREIVRLQPDPARRPKMLALTATALADDRNACLTAGMDDCLSKPVSPKAFAACIGRLFPGLPIVPTPATAVVPPTPGQPPLVDFARLDEAIPGLSPAQRTTMHRRMHRAVASDFETIWPRVADAVSRRDQANLAGALHALKGCFSTLGWTRIAGCCEAKMTLARARQFVEWSAFPDELQRLYAASSAEMTRYLAAASSDGSVTPKPNDEGKTNR